MFLEVDGIKQGSTGSWDCRGCPHEWTQLWKEEGFPDFHPSTPEDLQQWVSSAGSQLSCHQLASLGWSSLSRVTLILFSWRSTSGPSGNVTMLSPFPKANSYCQNQLFKRDGLCKQQNALKPSPCCDVVTTQEFNSFQQHSSEFHRKSAP